MLFIIYFLIFAFFFGLYLLHQPSNNQNLRNIPNIKGLIKFPLLGQALHILFDRSKWIELVLTYDVDSTPVKMNLLTPLVLLSRPEDLQIVLTSSKCMAKNYFYDLIRPYMGEGLLTAPVHKWKKNRKIVQTTFNQVILNQFVEIFSTNSITFNDTIDKLKGKTFDLYPYFFKYSINTIFETTLDVTMETQTRASQLCGHFIRARDIAMERILNVFLYLDPIFHLTNMYKEEKEILSNFYTLVEENLKKKKDQFLKTQKDKDLASQKNRILVDKLLELQAFSDKISDLELIDEIKTFVIAGSETTASTACLVLTMMAMYPEIQEKVYEEVMNILGPTNPVIYTDIDKFEYLDKVIKETMRLFPIAAFILRKAEDDVKLSTCIVPRGCDMILSIFALMRSEKYYPNPLTFNPERFTLEEIKKRPPYTYLPFSAGPRNCIGRHYAMMSLKTIIPTCVREFRFETDYKRIEDIKLDVTILIKAVNGYPIRAIRRNTS